MNKYDDKTVLVDELVLHIMFSIKALPNLNFGAALAFPQARSGKEAVQMWVEEYLSYTPNEPSNDSLAFSKLSGQMALEINQTLTDFYDGYDWQHVPEYLED